MRFRLRGMYFWQCFALTRESFRRSGPVFRRGPGLLCFIRRLLCETHGGITYSHLLCILVGGCECARALLRNDIDATRRVFA